MADFSAQSAALRLFKGRPVKLRSVGRLPDLKQVMQTAIAVRPRVQVAFFSGPEKPRRHTFATEDGNKTHPETGGTMSA